jgi:hypothetical protein
MLGQQIREEEIMRSGARAVVVLAAVLVPLGDAVEDGVMSCILSSEMANPVEASSTVP